MHKRASGAALGTVLVAALSLGMAAGPAHASCTNTVINGTTVCVPNSDGGVPGGGSGVVGGGGSTVPGGAGGIVPGGGGAPAPLPQAPAPAAPYVPPLQAPAPAAPVPAVVPAAPFQGQYVAPQNYSGPQSEVSLPVPAAHDEAIPAEAEPVRAVVEAPVAEAPVEATPVAPEIPSTAAVPTASTEPSPASAPTTTPLEGEQTSNASTSVAGFIAGALAVLVAAASILYWRKRRPSQHASAPKAGE